MADKTRLRRRPRAKKRLDSRLGPTWHELEFRPEPPLHQPPPDDPEGGAGVREPRRPRPQQPAGAATAQPQPDQQLDVTAIPA